MRTLGNILWHIPFLGFLDAIGVWLLGLLLTVTVVAAPIGLGLMEYGKFLFAPFSNDMVSKSDLNVKQHSAWRAYSTIVMILYFPFGLLLCLFTLVQIVGLFFTIIGIPVALVLAKSLGTYLNPVNKVCVPQSVADEVARRKALASVDRHLGVAMPSRSAGAVACPTCGRPIDSAAPFCAGCGANLVTSPGRGDTQAGTTCTTCGARVADATATFCPQCGTGLQLVDFPCTGEAGAHPPWVTPTTKQEALRWGVVPARRSLLDRALRLLVDESPYREKAGAVIPWLAKRLKTGEDVASLLVINLTERGLLTYEGLDENGDDLFRVAA